MLRLVVKKDNRAFSEFQFAADKPINIGRLPNSGIFLPDKAISKQHAVIFITEDGKWMIEDLDSANKTHLNGQAIHKAEIKTGDHLRISDFVIEINIQNNVKSEKPVHLDDTLIVAPRGPQIIVRDPTTEQAPPIRLPAKRASDFAKAIEAMGNVENLDKMLVVFLNIVSTQFDAYRAWCALRTSPSGAMTCHGGKQGDGQKLELENLELSKNVKQSVEKNQFQLFLFSRTPNQKQGMRSALISPIIGIKGCFGVIYVDNAIGDDHYSLSDLDYLMLLSIHTASILKKL